MKNASKSNLKPLPELPVKTLRIKRETPFKTLEKRFLRVFCILPPRGTERRDFSGLFGRFYRVVFGGVLAPFLLFVFTACSGDSSGSSSNSGGNGGGDDPNRQYKLVFKEHMIFRETSNSRGIALSPDQGDVYLTSQNSDNLGRLDRDSSGSLTLQGLWKDGSGDGKGNVVEGLDNPVDVVVSPDNRHVYVAGFTDDALVRFSRDATGDLTFAQVLNDGSGDVDGLDGAAGLAISADGRQVYVAGYADKSLAVFNRDTTTGALAFGAIFKNGTGGVDGLDGANGIAVSPDGKNVYVSADTDDALAVFNRNTATGALAFVTFLKDGSTDADGNRIDGLNNANGIAVSPDGKNIYVVGVLDNALAVFNRNLETGALTFGKVFKNNEDGIGSNMDEPRYVAVSADGKNVYVSAYNSSTLVVFDRAAATGALTFRRAVVNGDSDGVTVTGLFSPNQLVLSSDGGHLYLVVAADLIHFSREVR